jgi:hypothetical protein
MRRNIRADGPNAPEYTLHLLPPSYHDSSVETRGREVLRDFREAKRWLWRILRK